MFNIWLGIFLMLVHFSFLVLFYRLYGKVGLFVWIGFATIIANIQVLKLIDLFSFQTTLGNSLYGSIFLATDLLNEKYGKKDAQKGVWLGFTTLISATVMMQIVLLFQPAPQDNAQTAFEAIFGLLPRIAFASVVAYLISQFLDVRLFSLIRDKFPSKNEFWIRINGSTLISQLVDTLIFTSVAFLGDFPLEVVISIAVTTYVLKFIVTIVGTPFGYLARSFNPKE